MMRNRLNLNQGIPPFVVVSKDNSIVSLENSAIVGAYFSEVSAFPKKSEFDPASISVKTTRFTNCKKITLFRRIAIAG